MTMYAYVQSVECNKLVVCDRNTKQEVIVYTAKAKCFDVGDYVCIYYNGIMTMSIPPQIQAQYIRKIRSCR